MENESPKDSGQVSLVMQLCTKLLKKEEKGGEKLLSKLWLDSHPKENSVFCNFVLNFYSLIGTY